MQKQSLIYKLAGTCAIWLDIYQSPANEPSPCILWLHGGALIVGSRNMLLPAQLNRYLQAGYTVVAADYRLAPESKLDAILEDIADAYHWIRTTGVSQFNIDINRIGVVGHSAGGYLALLAGTKFSPVPKALVSFYGYGDIAGDWYGSPSQFYSQLEPITPQEARRGIGSKMLSSSPVDERSDFYLYCRQQGTWAYEVTGYSAATQQAQLKPYCPVVNLTHNYPPTLLLHGELDTDVPYEQSLDMANALRASEVGHELITLPNAGHGFDGEGDGLADPLVNAVFESVIGFLDGHLKTTPGKYS